ncbi:hypothetical protein [Chitinophaga parva]|nr:hypothetical protein [Chitinophaga parva]
MKSVISISLSKYLRTAGMLLALFYGSTTTAQDDYRPPIREAKLQILERLWQKHLYCADLQPGQTGDHMLLVLPDSEQVHSYDTIIDCMLAIYQGYIAHNSEYNVESVFVSVSLQSDSTIPVANGYCKIPCELFADLKTENYLSYLLHLSPYALGSFMEKDEIVARLKYPEAWNKRTVPVAKAYLRDLTGVVGKHFFFETTPFTRLLIIWKDNKGAILPQTYLPLSHAFKKAVRSYP